MKIAVEGCAHGELEKIYECIETLQERESIKVDLLICCGDFQSVRNASDLMAMAVPDKFKEMCTFYKYYSGEKKAPILTLFIGGNHEASNYLQELPYGGWVAPNIYYLGRSGVIRFGDLRIGGISGIFKGHDYLQGLWESVPYTSNSLRSVYHIRSLDVFRLNQLKDKVHVMLSHDWPRGITDYGDVEFLLRRKTFLREDIESNRLGSVPTAQLLHKIKPDYWFAAHLHCKFAALVPHDNEEETKFLALDKCLPRRNFLQILDVPSEFDGDKTLKYDLEWLAVLRSTNHLLSVKNIDCHMPGPGGNERYDFTPTEDEQEAISKILPSEKIDENDFVRTAPIYDPSKPRFTPSDPIINPQTTRLCELLGLDDPVQVVVARAGRTMRKPEDFSSVPKIEPETLENPVAPKIMSKLFLPEPVTPSNNKDNDEDEPSKEFLTPHSTSVADSVNSDDCSTPVSATKKTFKRRNVSIYNTPDIDEAESTGSTILDDSPCKISR